MLIDMMFSVPTTYYSPGTGGNKLVVAASRLSGFEILNRTTSFEIELAGAFIRS